MQKFTLVSFDICPYVLRAVAFMYHKGLDYKIEYIDIFNKPDWFLKISPFGKVPILQIGDQVLFESNVILEYMDEVNQPSIQPTDPIKKALNKGYYTLSTEFLVAMRNLLLALDETSFIKERANLQALLDKLENLLPAQGPYFNGPDIALIDFTFAPVSIQLRHIEKYVNFDVFQTTPKVKDYAHHMLQLESVKKAQVPDFDQIVYDRYKKVGPYYQTLQKL